MDKKETLYPAGQTSFAPELTIPNGVTNIDFYKNAFGAVEHMRLNNDDGSVHVAEFFIEEAMFYVHEKTQWSKAITPDKDNAGTVKIGLMVMDVHGLMDSAIKAGAELVSPVQDYEYGYRQCEIKDPFGHHWVLQCRIPTSPDWKG
jgi:PhnB protein